MNPDERDAVYQAAFDEFIEDRKLDHDDTTWSAQDRRDWRVIVGIMRDLGVLEQNSD